MRNWLVYGVLLTINDIDCCHRLGNASSSGQPRHIIIKFIARWKKQELVAAKKVRRNGNMRDLNLNIPGLDRQIFLNESLTKFNRLLLVKCKNYKKLNNVVSLGAKWENFYAEN